MSWAGAGCVVKHVKPDRHVDSFWTAAGVRLSSMLPCGFTNAIFAVISDVALSLMAYIPVDAAGCLDALCVGVGVGVYLCACVHACTHELWI